MNAESLFDDPGRRRWWLLWKALESTPLDEALQLVRAAEDFLNGSACTAIAPSAGTKGMAPLPRTDDRMVDDLLSSEPLRLAASQAPGLGLAEVDSEVDADKDEIAETIEDEVEPAPLAPVSAVFDGLVVMATPEDVIRYLRQRDDVVVPTPEGTYLVNGRFRLELDELVKRANGMRSRQNLPIFTLARLNFSAPKEKAAVNVHSPR